MPSGKRKHDQGEELVFGPVDDEGSESKIDGPVLVAFPGIEPRSDTVFNIYKHVDASKPRKAKQRIIAGETERVEFAGSNFGEGGPKGVHCRYLIGVRSKSSNALILKEAPVFALSRTVKALKTLSAAKSNPVEQSLIAKAALGEAFGTKKSKQKIKAFERNMVDTSTMQNVADAIQEGIEEKTSSLPTKEEIRLEIDAQRPIPPYNLLATSAEDIYNQESIVSNEEMVVVPIKELLGANTREERTQFLPFRTSTFINDRLDLACSKTGKKDRQRIRTLVYLSYMMAFFTLREHQLSNRDVTSQFLLNPPSVIVDGLYERFMSDNLKWTPIKKDRMLCYMLLLSLIIDQYSTDPAILTKDLSLKPQKAAQLFKTLGCKVEKLTMTQRTQQGLSPSEAKGMKRATLVTPLTFPEPRFKKKS